MKKYARYAKSIGVNIYTHSLLPAEWDDLLGHAAKARQHADPDITGFMVGCAIRDEDGAIHLGANFEPATLSQCTHAEQAALAVMIATKGPYHKIKDVAIVLGHRNTCLPYPPIRMSGEKWSVNSVDQMLCGHCFCTLQKYCTDKTMVIALQAGGEIAVVKFFDLMPFAFRLHQK